VQIQATYLSTEILPGPTPPDPASVEWPKKRKRSVHPELAVGLRGHLEVRCG
jgi:hypothetical protein